MAKGKKVIGLDIGSSSVKITQLNMSKKGYDLENFAMAPLPPETIVDGALMNSSAVAEVIRHIIHEEKIKAKEVVIGISGHSVIIKKINLPEMTDDELKESIKWEAEQHIPFDIEDVYIDMEVVNRVSAVQGQMDVLLVAAKKEMINDYRAVVVEAGLEPVVVDVDAFAVFNQFEINYEVPKEETIVLITMGASVININVIQNGLSAFTRDISMGGNQFTEEIQRQLGVSYEEAEALKIGGAYGTGDEDTVVPQEVERVIASVADTVSGEIQRSLDFFMATNAEAQLSKIYLAGGTAKIPSLYRGLEKKMGVPVELINPFRNISIDPKQFDPDYLQEVAPMAAVSVGLALRRPFDRK
ncbi:MAG: type IV pilus assembly protein PilM [Myxococcota bacterium]